MTSLWWGTYPAEGLGAPVGMGEGMWLQDSDGVTQVLELPAPSFLVAHPSAPLVYAISEAPASVLHVIDVSEPTAPVVRASVPTRGTDGCHLLLSREADALYVSHYGSGDLAVVPLLPDGLPGLDEPIQSHGNKGHGPRADRQEASHAHSAAYAPDGRHVLVADLGTDQLRRYRVDPGGVLEADGVAATLPGGSGPRHMATRGEMLYVACELDGALRTFRWDAQAREAVLIDEQSITPVASRSADESLASHVVVLDDVLLVGMRGADVIAVFDLSPEGWPRYRASFDVGHWPRYFAAIGDHLHVACERGHRVRAYALADVLALAPEQEVGAIAELPYDEAVIVSPACVVER
ncbi:lactonase family protein [Demequina capsici]|uniref:Beta-propeller fold lactonase family protein n=1 Tax=Demequina capsici TaxID=3075620 RepID=A0AA96F840_9MICO|nr:beta-propeller fold lactonase family protein [Demequina sp. OYTSA14]WNM24938.1 beta-propeller fold lactonase family protein [Demequina sp. OYTSA14]